MKIQSYAWWTKSWNPITGCTPVSEGCKHCYAREMHNRFAAWRRDPPFSTVVFHEDRLGLPMTWRKPQRIFVNSMSDLWHEQVSDHQILSVLLEVCECWHHIFFILTKRPERMKKIMSLAVPTVDRLWLGVTVENQARADERIPLLLTTPCAHRFISVEPMLGEIDIRRYLETGKIEWVIMGQETGRGARPCDPAWKQYLRNQCETMNIPFFDKQGENHAEKGGIWRRW